MINDNTNKNNNNDNKNINIISKGSIITKHIPTQLSQLILEGKQFQS